MVSVFKRSLWQRMEWRGTDNTGGGKFSLLFQDLALHLGWKLHEGRDMMLSPNSGMIAGSFSTPSPVERPPCRAQDSGFSAETLTLCPPLFLTHSPLPHHSTIASTRADTKSPLSTTARLPLG